MTLTARTPGAWAEGTTSVTPALPAASAVGDMMICIVGAKPYNCTIATPTGWTAISAQQTNGSTASSVDDGSVTWRAFYRIKESGDGNPAITVTSGNVALACVHSYSKTQAVWSTPTAYHGSDTSSGPNLNLTFASSSGALTSGDELISFMVIPTDTPNPASPTIAATSATIGTVTESPSTDGSSTLGDDLRASTATASVTAGTASADATGSWTFLASTTGGGSLIRLREIPGTLYYVIYPSAGGTPSAAQIKAGQNSSGTAATASGSEASPSTSQTFTFASAATGLSGATSYKIAFVWSDGTNNSNVAESSAWATTNFGTIAATDAADTASFAGDVLINGTLAVTETGSDTAAFNAGTFVQGSFAVVESGSDTAALVGDVYVQGSLAATDSADTASMTGDVYVRGSLAVSEAADTSQFYGSTTGAIWATLAATETGSDTASFGQSGSIIDPGVGLDTTWTPAAAANTTWTESSMMATNWTREAR